MPVEEPSPQDTKFDESMELCVARVDSMRDSMQNLMENVDYLVVQDKHQRKEKADEFIINCVEIKSSIEHVWAHANISGRELLSFRFGQKVEEALEVRCQEVSQQMTNNGAVTIDSDSEGELHLLKRARSSWNL